VPEREHLPRLERERERDNGRHSVPRFDELVEPPSRLELAGLGVAMLVSATLVGLGVWKAAELIADAA